MPCVPYIYNANQRIDASVLESFTDNMSSRQEAEAFNRQAQAIDRETTINDINSTISATPNTNPSQNNEFFTRQASQAARALGAMAIDADSVSLGLTNKASRDEKIREIVASTNPANYTGFGAKYLDFATKLKEAFASGRAKVEEFFLSTVPEEGNTVASNRLVALLHDTPFKQAALMKEFESTVFSPILDVCNNVGKGKGLPPEEVRKLLGKATYALHVPEATEWRIEKYNREIDELIKNRRQYKNSEDFEREHNRLLTERNMLIGNSQMEVPIVKDKRVPTVLYSIPESERILTDIGNQLGASREDLINLTQPFRDGYKKIQQKLAEQGLIGENITNDDLLQSLDYFFPIRTNDSINLGFVNDSTVFNAGTLHVRNLINNPDSITDAFTVLSAYARRAARHIASEPLAEGLHAIADRYADVEDITQRPVIAYPYEDAVRQLGAGANGSIKIGGLRINSDFSESLVYNRVSNNNGERTLQKSIVFFNPLWKHGQLDLNGRQLNDSIHWSGIESKFMGHDAIKAAGRLTGRFSSLWTRFTGIFPLINTFRDTFERVTNIGNQTYRLEDGTLVNGSNFRWALIGNDSVAAETFFQRITGNLDPESVNGKLLKEYVTSGLEQEFTQGLEFRNETNLDREQLSANTIRQKLLNNPKFRGLKQVLMTASEDTLRKFFNWVDGWNNYWNNIAPFSQFMTLRKNGIALDSAVEGVRELYNVREKGKATDLLRVFFPFVQSSIQGGSAMLKGLGLAPNASGYFKPTKQGVYTTLGILSAYAMLYQFMKGSLGKDDNGNDIADTLPITDFARNILINVGDGDIVKIPMGFGISQIAATMVTGADRLYRGITTPSDFTFDTLAAIVRNVSPADLPTFVSKEDPFKSLIYMITPELLKGAVGTSMNINNFGRVLTFEQGGEGLTPLAEQGKISTASWYHEAARWMQRNLGIDLAPEQLKNMMDAYLGGPLKYISGMLTQSSVRAAGIDKNTQEVLGPVATALGVSMIYKHHGNFNRFQYYMQKEKLEKEVRELGLHPPSKLKGDERDAWWQAQLEERDWDSNKISKLLTFLKADRDLLKLSRDINTVLKSNGSVLDYTDNRDELKELFTDYAQAREDIYASVLNSVSGL